MTLDFEFPFEYVGGGFYRRKDVPRGEKAEVLHGTEVVEQAWFAAYAAIREHFRGHPKYVWWSKSDVTNEELPGPVNTGPLSQWANRYYEYCPAGCGRLLGKRRKYACCGSKP